MAILENLADISLEAAPWLLLGFLCAGLIKAWLPADLINRWLGGDGIWPVTKAALIGAPLPLCSCGVLPAATSLRRNGASRSSTVSFLIATPETGVDSLALSYALLGPVMALIRPVAAIGSAIFTGLLTLVFGAERARAQVPADGDMLAVFEESCGDNQCSDKRCTTPPVTRQGLISRTLDGLRYGLVDMVDDLVLWLAFGLLLAALMQTFAPPMVLADWGSGLPAMLLMLLVGIPTYICATASTPIAAALLIAGVSPGTVLVFLLAGPATNIATMGVIHQEMGTKVLIAYLTGIAVSSVGFGLLTDALLQAYGIDVHAQVSAAPDWLPAWLVYSAATVLLLAAVVSLAKRLQQRLPSAARENHSH
ncbi:permease [Candidatus Tenderia electrophaga]|uniref:Permease n=1 Tax=Candidatus Tenderia electrophaga TaxID=1748243 RepID=A0A0S2TI15_9GAMM|nr:permease [Candidatus Tenderia electrophaga]